MGVTLTPPVPADVNQLWVLTVHPHEMHAFDGMDIKNSVEHSQSSIKLYCSRDYIQIPIAVV